LPENFLLFIFLRVIEGLKVDLSNKAKYLKVYVLIINLGLNLKADPSLY